MRRNSNVQFVQLALLIAIILIMAFTPLGYIRTGAVSITLLVVPVAVGSIIMGPSKGAILGAVFGLTSYLGCVLGTSPLGSAMFSVSPIYAFIVCVPTRILAGWIPGVVYKLLSNYKKTSKISCYFANLMCPLCNTIFFMTALCVFYFRSDYIQNLAGGKNALLFIIGFVGINAVIEAFACFLLGTAVTKVLLRVAKNA